MFLEHIKRLEHENACLRTQQEITAVEQQMRDIVMQCKKVSPKVELQSPFHNDSDVRAPNLSSIRDENITMRRNKPSTRVLRLKLRHTMVVIPGLITKHTSKPAPK